MKKAVILLALLLPLCAEENLPLPQEHGSTNTRNEVLTSIKPDNQRSHCDELERWYLSFKPGYYYLVDSRARDIYGSGGFIMHAEADYRVYSDYMLIWFEGSYFTKNGHSRGFEHISTKLQIGSLTLGLKGIYFWESCALYGGAGPLLFFFSSENNSPYVKDQNRTGIGGGFTAGLLIFPWDRSLGYFDLFLDYSLKTMHFSPDGKSSIVHHDANISGITGGLGLGVRF